MPESRLPPAPAPATPALDTLHGLFEAATAAHPERAAIRHAGAVTSYGALNARANRIAHRLRELGVGPESAVAVFLPRTPELVASMLGVLKAGGAYVPIDPAYPAAHTAVVLDDARAAWVLAGAGVAERLPVGAPVLVLDALDGCPDADPPPAAGPGNLAYVIHTSGSTGRPKGVAIEHRNALPLLRWWRDTVAEEERAATLAATSVCFDASILEVFGTLAWGGTMVLVDDALALAGCAEEVRVACMVPSAAGALLRAGSIPATVRTLSVGGEPMPPSLARDLFARTGARRVFNVYGPSEDTTYSTCAELAPEQAAPIPVGVPVAGGAVHVLDSGYRSVPDGEEGELFTAGPGVARGYLGSPALTAERFLPDAHGSRGSRMYRTGDLGRRRNDGALECAGRTDHQAKIRGFRVEPGAVQAALLDHPGVEAAAVVAPTDETGGRFLAAYVVGGAGADELRAWLRDRLPAYMVPTAWTPLAALPLTPSGKVDRRALPEPAAPRPERVAGSEPRTRAGIALAAIWAEVLGVERPGLGDDFYALGGHSLRAVQIASRVRDTLGVALPLPVLFRNPTLEGQACELERLLHDPATTAEPIPRADRSRPIPLSAAQEAVWFFERLSPGMRSYQFQGTLRMRGALDVDALRRALAGIVRRHEIFRTAFVEEEGRPVQRILPPWPVDLPVRDLSALERRERDAELARSFEAEFARPLRIAEPPLVRWTLYRVAPDDHVLLVVEHHLVHDGWSFGIFLRELAALYEQEGQGGPPLPEPRVQFADYAAWQRAWLAGPEAEEHRAYWRARLRGAAPVLELPTDHPRPPRATFRGHSMHVRLPRDVVRAADAFARRHGATPYMTLLAAFQALMARRSGQAEFVLGMGAAARGRRELEEVIGMLVNVIPLRADLRGDPGLGALVERVRSAAGEEYAHQDLPFSEIVDAVQPPRTLDRNPIFQVAFNAHHAPYPEMRMGGVELEVTEGLGNHTAKFDLQAIVIFRAQQNAAADDEVIMVWEYSTDLFRHETVERLARQYETLLRAMLADPARPLSRIPLPGDEEHARTLREWGRTPGRFPRGATVHGLFAEEARSAPEAPAAQWEGRTLSYTALDRASAHLAARLEERGIGGGDRVGVWAEGGLEMVVAMLGALRAGAAYVPLAPEYPAARLRWMMEDAGITALLASPGSVPPGVAGLPVLEVDANPAHPLAAPEHATAHPESLACILYTSGTTGTPKGIGVPHRAIVRLVRGADYAPLGRGDRVAQTASPSFDPVLWEVWGALLNGATVVGVEREVLFDPARLAAWLRDERITAAFLTTALFHRVARAHPGAFAGMGTVIFGGEAVDAEAVRAVLAAGPPERLVNGYGPTEGTTFSTAHRVESLSPGAPVPIGRPVPGSEAYVLDDAMGPVPEGTTGEVYIGGAGVARGYLGRPGATAERFVPDPFGAPGGVLYRTGDLARWSPGGVLEFVGRADGQVKIRGFRVEPGEVEAALRALPGISAAAVVVRGDGEDRALAAYAVAAPGASCDPAALRTLLAERVPPFLVPATVTLLAALPLTPNGKVDRAALPEPVVGRGSAALTPDEERVAEAWRAELGVEHVGPDDDFFVLGGHSLRAARVAARIGEVFGITLPVAAVFQLPTVRALAASAAGCRAAALDERFAWLETLSDEEAEALLREG